MQRLLATLLVLWSRIWHLFQVQKPTDTGYFDPYQPLSRLKNSEEPDTEEADWQISNPPAPSYWWLNAVLIVFALIIINRLVSLQVVEGQTNYRLAEGNRLQTVTTLAPRGIIYDSHGVALTENLADFAVNFDPEKLPKDRMEKDQLLTRLAADLGLEKIQLEKVLTDGRTQPAVVIKDKLNREQALSLEIKLSEVNGASVVRSSSRRYTYVPGLSQILGYLGKVTEKDITSQPNLQRNALVGRDGLERVYDQHLQGINGIDTYEVDSRGRRIRSVGSQPPLVGQSLILGLDLELEKQAAASLAEALIKSGAHSGAAVVMNPQTGEIRAMVSLPSYDNNLFATNDPARFELLTSEGAPLINRAISGQYPPGSTIKPVVASAALTNGVITPNTKLDTSEGKIVIGATTFPDWKVHGLADVEQAIAESNNIFFGASVIGWGSIKQGLGINRLTDFERKWGFGQVTGIDLPSEGKGLVPTPDWKKQVKKESWYVGDSLNVSIGQGDMLATPLQMARAVSVIANGGSLVSPHLVKSIIDSNGQEIANDQLKSSGERVVTQEVTDTVKAGMRQAVLTGSARSFAALPVEVAAKTGTAQFNVSKDKTHSWFTAFAPYKNPELAIAIIVEGGGEGYAVAAPVARNIVERYFKLPITPINPVVE